MELSLLIPARNEEFLARTVRDILEHMEADTEIMVVLDGYWPEPGLPQHERLTVVHLPESIGQRAATNLACELASGKYVMKVDAHCAFDQGFDRKMLALMAEDITMVPVMRNLHAFDWVCSKGHRRYQGPSGPCQTCGEPTIKDVVWIAKESPKSVAYRFDKTLHFQYFNEFGWKQKGDLTETMSLQGSCFMLSREKYWSLNICDESWGSWGNQGTEVACKTWLSGGRVLCNRTTWYAHMFRTQGGDFSFPYHNPESKIEHARQCSRDLFLNDKYPQAIHPFSWLINKFNPPDWQGSKGIIFYTDNRLKLSIAHAVQKNLKRISKEKGIPIVCASLKKMDFGDKNIHFPHFKRGFVTMYRQILAALEHSEADIIYFCEHDILYHPSHFDFVPPKRDVYYYNRNVWQLRLSDGHCLYYDCQKLSQLVGYRDFLITHFKKRLQMCEDYKSKCEEQGIPLKYGGYHRNMGFEPGTHHRPDRVDDFGYDTFCSAVPNIDIRHDGNHTASRWSKEEFASQLNCQNWQEADEVPGWGKVVI